MIRCRTLLTFLSALVALSGRGALEYVAYDLVNKTAEVVSVDSQALIGDTYRTGTKILFVRDAEFADSIYMGVYEVTQTQAHKFGWLSTEPSADTAGIAYGGFDTANNLESFSLLSFPSSAQWEAYAGEPAKPCNVFNGIDVNTLGPLSLSEWLTYAQSKTLPAPHGCFDMYGNVAEFVSEGSFRGGYADGTVSYDTNTLKTKTWQSASIGSGTDGFGRKGVRLVYTPPEAVTYQATVTLDGEQVGAPISATPGTEVTLTPPTPAEGNRLQGPKVTPADLVFDGTTFLMPEADVTFAYTSKPYATLQVIGGTASASEVVEGDTVTLTATPGAYQIFKEWTLPDGSTATESPLSYTVPSITPGKTLTFTASFQTYPRVLVYGGTASASEGADYGEGFYAPGTELTLTPTLPEGYTFDRWTSEGGEALRNNTYTVGDYDSTVTLTASFTVAEATSSVVTYIGEADPAAEVKTMKAALGYESSTALEWTAGANTFQYFPYAITDKSYATLPLATGGAIVYSADFSDLLGLNKGTSLPLKQVTANGSTYYIGVYETTQAHVEYIKQLADKDYTKVTEKLTSYLPHYIASVAEAEGYLATLNVAFPMNATLPSKEQIVNITKAYCTDKTYKDGAGHLNTAETYGDPTITTEMIVYGRTGSPATVGSKKVDPYGFYDLWGNANEVWSDGQLWGGSFAEFAHFCNSYTYNATFSTLNNSYYPSFRPAAVVPKALSVTVEVDGKSLATTVLPEQVIRLAPQVKTGHAFTGWTATTGSGETPVAVADDGSYPYTVTEAVTLTATFAEKRALTVIYEKCLGPESVLPGATVTLYAADPTGEAPTSVTTSPAEAATWNAEAGTLTFSETASGSVSVKATYPDPTPPKPGYKVYLQ
ncbi:MAG: hypothetical protein ACI4RT_05880 [Candidatus Spyradenecus sp.]